MKETKHKPKFKFLKTKDEDNRFDTSNVLVTSDAETLEDILTDFEDFLRGCGYVFDGHLDIIEEDIAPISEDDISVEV